MNSSLITLELCVIAIGIVLMLADFWMPAERKKFLAYAAIAALGGLLLVSLGGDGICSQFGTAFSPSSRSKVRSTWAKMKSRTAAGPFLYEACCPKSWGTASLPRGTSWI